MVPPTRNTSDERLVSETLLDEVTFALNDRLVFPPSGENAEVAARGLNLTLVEAVISDAVLLVPMALKFSFGLELTVAEVVLLDFALNWSAGWELNGILEAVEAWAENVTVSPALTVTSDMLESFGLN